mgnify:CR=1 FL=1
MTAAVQGEPGKEHLTPEPVPPVSKPFVFRHGDLGHLAHLLTKASAWVRNHPEDVQHEVAFLADADYRVPKDEPNPEFFRMEWIVDPVIRELIRVLERSEVELFVVVRAPGECFLLSRRRKLS